MRTTVLLLLSLTIQAYSQNVDSEAQIRQEQVARAKSLELATPYVPPPGDPLVHETAGYAKVVCSAVFISGFTAEFAAENLGYVISPYADRKKVGKPIVDRKKKTISIALPDGTKRIARYTGSQGCVSLPPGRNSTYFKPERVKSRLPGPDTETWPMGDRPEQDQPLGLDVATVKQAVDAAFDPPTGMTAAFVVVWKGHIIGERYGEGAGIHTPLEGWSMGKSISGTLMARLIEKGVYDLWQPAPVPEWNDASDPRSRIRIADLLHMSSGLRIKAPNDPDFDGKGYPDHLYLYTGDENLFQYAATRPLEWPPNTVGRYRNTDPMIINYLIRLAVEKHHGDYFSFPQRELFDQLGIRTMVIEPDAYGNLLSQGYVLGCARDWARLGLLYLQDGVWNGKRVLPEGFVEFVSTVAPAWGLDHQPEYGGFFWINGIGRLPIPKDAYFMGGAGNQFTIIIPSRDLVVVRLGIYKGDGDGFRALNKSLSLLMKAIPENSTAPRG